MGVEQGYDTLVQHCTPHNTRQEIPKDGIDMWDTILALQTDFNVLDRHTHKQKNAFGIFMTKVCQLMQSLKAKHISMLINNFLLCLLCLIVEIGLLMGYWIIGIVGIPLDHSIVASGSVYVVYYVGIFQNYPKYKRHFIHFFPDYSLTLIVLYFIAR